MLPCKGAVVPCGKPHAEAQNRICGTAWVLRTPHSAGRAVSSATAAAGGVSHQRRGGLLVPHARKSGEQRNEGAYFTYEPIDPQALKDVAAAQVESESEFGWAQKSRSTEQDQRYKYSKIDENLQGKGPKTPAEKAYKEQVAVWKAKQLQQRIKAQKNQLIQEQRAAKAAEAAALEASGATSSSSSSSAPPAEPDVQGASMQPSASVVQSTRQPPQVIASTPSSGSSSSSSSSKAAEPSSRAGGRKQSLLERMKGSSSSNTVSAELVSPVVVPVVESQQAAAAAAATVAVAPTAEANNFTASTPVEAPRISALTASLLPTDESLGGDELAVAAKSVIAGIMSPPRAAGEGRGVSDEQLSVSMQEERALRVEFEEWLVSMRAGDNNLSSISATASGSSSSAPNSSTSHSTADATDTDPVDPEALAEALALYANVDRKTMLAEMGLPADDELGALGSGENSAAVSASLREMIQNLSMSGSGSSGGSGFGSGGGFNLAESLAELDGLGEGLGLSESALDDLLQSAQDEFDELMGMQHDMDADSGAGGLSVAELQEGGEEVAAETSTADALSALKISDPDLWDMVHDVEAVDAAFSAELSEDEDEEGGGELTDAEMAQLEASLQNEDDLGEDGDEDDEDAGGQDLDPEDDDDVDVGDMLSAIDDSDLEENQKMRAQFALQNMFNSTPEAEESQSGRSGSKSKKAKSPSAAPVVNRGTTTTGGKASTVEVDGGDVPVLVQKPSMIRRA